MVAARAEDAERLARILGDWVRETPWMPCLHSREEDLAHLEMMIRRFEVLCASTWKGPQGFLARDGDMVHSLYLAPGARGRGYGSRLLGAAKARSERLQLWCFQSNEGARRFYAREGFVEVELTDGGGNDEGLPDVRLIWPGPEEAA
nr:GNAT family N-acetyltransferase [Pseudoruegeria sp. HB172150]